ncbi:hypothetical protein [Nocardia brasiliensis]|uniref:hypothetical protein n=1 Tax=Nocardia brasiliensis TaxID=37326 RepID=UPI00245552FE|nr:hypothetical protein [Nocardia brasiliensis]
MSSSYKLTIAPEEPGRTAAVLTVELDAGGARVHDIRVIVGDDGTPLPKELAHIDFAVLVETAVLMSHGRLPVVAESTEVEPSPDHVPTGAAPATDTVLRADHSVARSTATAPPSGKARRASSSDHPSNGAPSDLAVTFWRLGSITKVAKHYDVPRHIAQDWIKVLSQDTKLPNSWVSKRNAR